MPPLHLLAQQEVHPPNAEKLAPAEAKRQRRAPKHYSPSRDGGGGGGGGGDHAGHHPAHHGLPAAAVGDGGWQQYNPATLSPVRPGEAPAVAGAEDRSAQRPCSKRGSGAHLGMGPPQGGSTRLGKRSKRARRSTSRDPAGSGEGSSSSSSSDEDMPIGMLAGQQAGVRLPTRDGRGRGAGAGGSAVGNGAAGPLQGSAGSARPVSAQPEVVSAREHGKAGTGGGIGVGIGGSRSHFATPAHSPAHESRPAAAAVGGGGGGGGFVDALRHMFAASPLAGLAAAAVPPHTQAGHPPPSRPPAKHGAAHAPPAFGTMGNRPSSEGAQAHVELEAATPRLLQGPSRPTRPAVSAGTAPVSFAEDPRQGTSAEPDRTPSVHSQGSSRGGPSPPVSQPLTQAATQSRLLRALLQPPPPPGLPPCVPSSAERLPGGSCHPHTWRPEPTPMAVPLSTAHSQPAGEQPLVTRDAGTAAAVLFGPFVSGRASPSHGLLLSLPLLPRPASSGCAAGTGQCTRGGSKTPLPLFLSVAQRQQPQQSQQQEQSGNSRQQFYSGHLDSGPLMTGVSPAGEAVGGTGGERLADQGVGPGGYCPHGEVGRGVEVEDYEKDDGKGEGDVLTASQCSGSSSERGGDEEGGSSDEGVSA